MRLVPRGWQPVVVVGVIERTPQASRQRSSEGSRPGSGCSGDQYSRLQFVPVRIAVHITLSGGWISHIVSGPGMASRREVR